MPIYEFVCNKCQAEFEARVARVGERPEACPHCGASDLGKLLSSFAAHTSSSSAAAPLTPCAMGSACGRVTGRGCGAN